MKKINIAEVDVAAVAKRIKDFSSHIPSTGVSAGTRSSAIKVIDCVLSLRTSYDRVVVPRLKVFGATHPDVQQVTELATLIENYPTPYEFIQQELDFNSERKAEMLQQVVNFLCQIVQGTPDISEEECLKKWAIQAEPSGYQTLNIRGFGIAGFQYLRMLFGADTTKPDVHIIRFLSNTLNRKVSAIESLLLLEAACECMGISIRAVDKYIWKKGARPAKTTDRATLDDELPPEYDETLLKIYGIRGKYAKQHAAGTNIVRLDPDVADAFPTEESVNKALRAVLKERAMEK